MNRPPFVTWPPTQFTAHKQEHQRLRHQTLRRVEELRQRRLRKQRREEWLVMAACIWLMGDP